MLWPKSLLKINSEGRDHMFCPLGYRDSMIIFRGLLILILVIFLGVGVAERQLNGLTQRQENVLALSVVRNAIGIYTIYIGGSNYEINAVYPVGEFINKDQYITVKTMQYDFVIPKYIELDCKKELALLDLYIRKIEEKINVYSKVP